MPDNFSTNALVSVKPHTGGLPHPILEQEYCKNPKGVVVHCLHIFTSSSDQTGADEARHVRIVRNIRILPMQHLAWRPSRAAGRRSVSGPRHVVRTAPYPLADSPHALAPIRPSPRSPYSQGRARSDPAPDGFRPVRFGCRGGYTWPGRRRLVWLEIPAASPLVRGVQLARSHSRPARTCPRGGARNVRAPGLGGQNLCGGTGGREGRQCNDGPTEFACPFGCRCRITSSSSCWISVLFSRGLIFSAEFYFSDQAY